MGLPVHYGGKLPYPQCQATPRAPPCRQSSPTSSWCVGHSPGSSYVEEKQTLHTFYTFPNSQPVGNKEPLSSFNVGILLDSDFLSVALDKQLPRSSVAPCHPAQAVPSLLLAEI